MLEDAKRKIHLKFIRNVVLLVTFYMIVNIVSQHEDDNQLSLAEIRAKGEANKSAELLNNLADTLQERDPNLSREDALMQAAIALKLAPQE